jgi:SNF2 family DNA or RNA helicase
LFAFRSPLSKGAILADEVGLGKTIEAGLVLAQKWTEGKRRILVISPANLRKQWSQEIEEKFFFLPTLILEAKNYNRMAKDGIRRQFEQKKLVICSFQFAARHADERMIIPWDLVVIDEAHRLSTHGTKRTNSIDARTSPIDPKRKYTLFAGSRDVRWLW